MSENACASGVSKEIEASGPSLVGCKFAVGHADLRRAFAFVRYAGEAGAIEWWLEAQRLTLVGRGPGLTCEASLPWLTAPPVPAPARVVLTCDPDLLGKVLCGRVLDTGNLTTLTDPGVPLQFKCLAEDPGEEGDAGATNTRPQTWTIALGSGIRITRTFARRDEPATAPVAPEGEPVRARRIGEVLVDLLPFAQTARDEPEGALFILKERMYAAGSRRARVTAGATFSPIELRLRHRAAQLLAPTLRQLSDVGVRMSQIGHTIAFESDRYRCAVDAENASGQRRDFSVPAGSSIRVDTQVFLRAITRVRVQVEKTAHIRFRLGAAGLDPTSSGQVELVVETDLFDGESARASCVASQAADAAPEETKASWQAAALCEDLDRWIAAQHGPTTDVHVSEKVIVFTSSKDDLIMETRCLLQRQH